LRLAFYDNEGAWGALLLFRAEGRFTDGDVAQLAPVARPFGSVLHHTLVRGDPPAAAPDVEVAAPPPDPGSASRSIRIPMPRLGRGRRAERPERPEAAPVPADVPPTGLRKPLQGHLTISGDGRLVDVTEDARALLDAADLDRVGAAVARGRVSGLVDAAAYGRHDGRWLTFHAKPQGTSTDVTVRRIRPHQVSEFVTQALGLEPWHRRLLGAIARDRDIRQIAADLRVSAYEVQDGMESLFMAFGVTGRIELVKALFFDHYLPLHAADARAARDS
jgi:hypothetical protein